MLRYFRQSWRIRRSNPGAPSWRQLWCWYPAWRRSRRGGGGNQLSDHPWFTFGALDFLNGHDLSGFRVYEWGSGGSSLYFARRAAHVVSVEHDPEWFQRVRSAVHDRHITNWEGCLQVPSEITAGRVGDPSHWQDYVSDDQNFRGRDFRSYAAHIDAFADESFDIVVIDGRARPSCLKHALPKVRCGGFLVWDNSEREYYFPAMEQIPESFKRIDFPGPGPFASGFWRTTIWIRQPSRSVRAA